MKNMLLSTVTLLLVPAVSFAAPEYSLHTHTNTPIELKPISQLSNQGIKTASICFMGYGDCDPSIGFDKGDGYGIDTENQCKNEGFTKQKCNSAQIIDNVCPYNTSYGKKCKCKPELITCSSIQTGVGEVCEGKYAACKCPTGITNLPYGCQEYYPAPCNSVCKKAYSDNCRNRVDNYAPYGCQTAWSDCSSKCQSAYPNNCRNRTAVSTPYGCQTAWSDCSSKCQSAYPDNCRNRTAVSIPYGCQTAWSDCSSKCQSAYPDNCRNRTAVSVPTKATCSETYSDCTSKCSAWKCDNGYNQSGSSCVLAHTHSYSCPSGYQVSACSSSQKTSATTSQTCSCNSTSGSCNKCVDKGCEDYGFYTGIKEIKIVVSNLTCYRNPVVGDIYYADGTLSDSNDKQSKTAIGVVAYVSGNSNLPRRFVVALQQTKLPWTNCADCDITNPERGNLFDGMISTPILLSQTATSYPAAQYCHTYLDGKWYLPADQELIQLSLKFGTINNTIAKIGDGTVLQADYYYASYWYFDDFRNGTIASATKLTTGQVATTGSSGYPRYVRCIMGF